MGLGSAGVPLKLPLMVSMVTFTAQFSDAGNVSDI